MSYIDTRTLERLEAFDIILANPDVSFPNRYWSDDDLEPLGYAELHEPTDPPTIGIYEKKEEIAPAEINGMWYVQFNILPMTEDEIAAKKQQIIDGIAQSTQARLDDFAKTRNYDGILSLCTYSTSTNAKFQSEGQYGVEARDATWAKLYEIMADVESGARPLPNGYADIEAELPALEWPAA